MSGGLTLSRALDKAARELGEAGIGDARHEARLLAAHVLGVTPEAVLRGQQGVFHGEQAAGFSSCVTARAARRPMAQILGRREFWSLPFRVTEKTLDPRPDSETLIEAVLDTVTDREAPVRILDLGTGTGCLLLALLHELPCATGVGVEVSVDALEVARGNGLGVEGTDQDTAVVENADLHLVHGRGFALILVHFFDVPDDLMVLAHTRELQRLVALRGFPSGYVDIGFGAAPNEADDAIHGKAKP